MKSAQRMTLKQSNPDHPVHYQAYKQQITLKETSLSPAVKDEPITPKDEY